MATAANPRETTDVHKKFKDIPQEETVIAHFTCGHKGKALKQGRLYVTQNYLLFFAQLVKTHKKVIKFTDVKDISPANYGVYPNAVKITLGSGKELLFASFLIRDKAYGAIRQEWLNAKDRTDNRINYDDGANDEEKKGRQALRKRTRKRKRNKKEEAP